MRFAGPSQFKIIDTTENNVAAENASNYMRSLYHQISSSLGRALDIIACDGRPGKINKCGQIDKASLSDGSMDVYKVILLNVTEKWLRSLKLLKPVMVSISSVDLKMVGQYVTSVLDRNLELLSNLFMPGLYGCAQSYMNKLMWRILESWI